MNKQPLYERSVDPQETEQLEAAWGVVPQQRVVLHVDDPFLTGENQLLSKNGRRAEICYVMHQGDPHDGVLLHIKTFYPPGAFRLPTGGIMVGEPVLDALAREIWEETGLLLGSSQGQVLLNRPLGILAYNLLHRTLGAVEFATYFFLVQMPSGALLQPQDEDEHIGGWQWRPTPDLLQVAATLDEVHKRSAVWGDWGHFRALGHRFVADFLV